MLDRKKYITRGTAQRRLGCSKQELLRLMDEGHIEFTRKDSGGYLIRLRSVNDYLERRNVDKTNFLTDRIKQLEQRIGLLEGLLKENGISLPENLREPLPGDPSFISAYPAPDYLPLSPRAKHILRANGITSVEQLAGISDTELMKLPHCGRKTTKEIRSLLASLNLSQNRTKNL